MTEANYEAVDPAFMEESEFQVELQRLINKHSKESVSNTPDFILAGFVSSCMAAFNEATNNRDRWFNLDTSLRFNPKSPLSDQQKEILWQSLGKVFGSAPRSPEACLKFEHVIGEMIKRG
jgi:hypothetical protein